MADFFLSYAREDERAAEQLKKLLESSCRVSIWMDSHKLLPGQRWEEQITEAIRLADGALFLASDYSLNKDTFVQRELELLLDRADAIGNPVFLILIKLDETPIENKRLRGLHWVHYHPENPNGCLDALAKVRAAVFNAEENREKEEDRKSAVEKGEPFKLHRLAQERLFTPDELDIYIKRETKEAFIFHGKEVDYASLDYLVYVPEGHKVLVYRKDRSCADLGVALQWLVRPHFLKAHEINIVRTKDGKSMDGVALSLRFAQEGSDGSSLFPANVNAEVLSNWRRAAYNFRIKIGSEKRYQLLLRVVGYALVLVVLLFVAGGLAGLARLFF